MHLVTVQLVKAKPPRGNPLCLDCPTSPCSLTSTRPEPSCRHVQDGHVLLPRILLICFFIAMMVPVLQVCALLG